MPNTNFQTLHQMGGAINSFVKQATGRDNMQNIDMEHITVAQNHYYDDVDISGRVVSFNAGDAGIPLDKCLVQIEPVQEGAGDPSPDNVHPISGWTGAKVTRTGKNLIPNIKSQASATTIMLGQTEGATVHSLFLKAGTYTLTVIGTVNGSIYVGSEKTLEGRMGSMPNCTFTLPEDDYISLRVYLSAGIDADTINSFQLELGSATAYEPYQGQTYEVTFPSVAGTVYGGALDVISGVLTVDRAYALLNNPDKWILTSGSADLRYDVPIGDRKFYNDSYSGLMCSYVPCVYGAEPYGRWNSANGYYFCIKSSAIQLDQVKADASAGKIAIAYELATPLNYQLTPQEVKTLLGTNNVWADTGDIEVKFKNIKEFF